MVAGGVRGRGRRRRTSGAGPGAYRDCARRRHAPRHIAPARLPIRTAAAARPSGSRARRCARGARHAAAGMRARAAQVEARAPASGSCRGPAPAAPRTAGRARARRGRCRRRSSPNSRSRSSGVSARRPSTLALKFGATRSTVSIIRSATSSRASSQVRAGPHAARRSGCTCWQNRLATCMPGGASDVVDDRRNQHLDDRRARPAVACARRSTRAPCRRATAR